MRHARLICWTLMGLLCFTSLIAAPLPVQPIPAERAQLMLDAVDEGIPFAPVLSGMHVAGEIVATPLLQVRGDDAAVINQLDTYSRTFERPLNREFVTTPVGSNYSAHSLSFSDAWRNPLDEPPCSLQTTASTTVSYFSGAVEGDAYKVWFDPAACPGCTPVYPFRVDSLRFQLVQADTGTADTVLIGIDIECAAFDPADPCNGPGTERCFVLYSIALPQDTGDGFLSVYDVVLPLDTCWVDGPFFVGLFHLGHTDIAHFHPNAALDGSATPPVAPCTAWANLSGTFQQWGDVWVDPDPGYPIMTLYGECNDPDAQPIEPCPVLCSQTRIGGGLQYYDATTTGVWAWMPEDPARDLSFPYRPKQIGFSLYYPLAGAADDSVTLLITYGCDRFDNVCCAPSDVICAGTISLVRGNPGEAFILDVSLDLSAMDCCVPSDFWIGAQIIAVGQNDPIPSFLWSGTTTDPTPVPPCEQWIYTGGAFEHWPQGGLVWWDVVLAGDCGSCDVPVNECTVMVPGTLNCAGATPIACEGEGVLLTGQTNSGGGDNVDEYCCVPWDESGPERVYVITVPNNGSLSIGLSNVTGGDVDVMLLRNCNPLDCVAGGDVGISVIGLTGGTYYIVVDGFNGDVATYDLEVTCLASCLAEICQNSLQPGPVGTGTRYLDGEWSSASGDTVYYTYYLGTGTVHHILKWSSATCDTFRRVSWTAAQNNSADRGLAYDPRNGGNFWTTTWLAPNAGRIYRLSATGGVLNTISAVAGIDTMRFSGMAFDPDHNHLWVFARGAAGYAPARAFEIDVTNPASPVLIQGPHVLTWLYPDSVFSSGGADYAESVDLLILAAQGTPLDFIQCFSDVDPAYAGPPPGPGLLPLSWCPPDSNSFQGFGLAAIDNGGDGSGAIHMLNFTDGSFQPHRVFEYPAPCVLNSCDPVTDLTVLRAGNDVTVRGTAPQAGSVLIFSTAVKNNSGDPANDPNFTLEATLPVTADEFFEWVDPAGVTPVYRNYVVLMQCD